MCHEDIRSEIDALFEPDADDESSNREWPAQRLGQRYGFNFDFMKHWLWEGATSHPNTRISPPSEKDVTELTRNMDVPLRLLLSSLRLFAESIAVYSGVKDGTTNLRFYPPVILTFWSAFETFVSYTSELMLLTSINIPDPVRQFLRETVSIVDRKGTVATETRYRPLLDRYVVLLRYGFGFAVDRGNPHWQKLEKAKQLRDYYAHIEATSSRSISSAQVLDFMETVLIGIIWPSAETKRTLLLGVHDVYRILAKLAELSESYLQEGHVEEPFFHSKNLNGHFMFYCPFVNVDTKRFPNSREERDPHETG